MGTPTCSICGATLVAGVCPAFYKHGKGSGAPGMRNPKKARRPGGRRGPRPKGKGKGK